MRIHIHVYLMFQLHANTLTQTLAALPGSVAQAPQQKRSHKRQKEWLAAGLKLTEERDWEALTIAEIAAMNGFSVGSFYTRFKDKQAYLEVLISVVAQQMRRKMDIFAAQQGEKSEDAMQTLDSFVDQAIHTFTRLRGIFRMSVLKKRNPNGLSAETPTSYPFTEARAYSCDQFTQLMLPLMNKRDEKTKQRLSFAHQMINSILVNTILTDPGPLQIEDAAFKQELVAAISAYLGLKASLKKSPQP